MPSPASHTALCSLLSGASCIGRPSCPTPTMTPRLHLWCHRAGDLQTPGVPQAPVPEAGLAQGSSCSLVKPWRGKQRFPGRKRRTKKLLPKISTSPMTATPTHVPRRSCQGLVSWSQPHVGHHHHRDAISMRVLEGTRKVCITLPSELPQSRPDSRT